MAFTVTVSWRDVAPSVPAAHPGPGDPLAALPEMGARLPLADLYDGVEFHAA